MDPKSARVEIACRLFAGDRLSLPAAARFAGLPRAAMEAELRRRDIPLHQPTIEEVRQDLAVLRDLAGRGEHAS
jgi:predicted HTH domain antitoxin